MTKPKVYDTGFTMVITTDSQELDVVIMRSYGQHGKYRVTVWLSGVDATVKALVPLCDMTENEWMGPVEEAIAPYFNAGSLDEIMTALVCKM